jgi:2-oxoglutaroyl-CoA hydrolase
MTEYPDSILRVEYRSDKPVAVLTFDAPPLNIITVPTREHFGAVFREIEANDAVRVVIVQSVGEHFSSGGDVVGFLKVTPEYISHFAENVAAPERCSKPVIARLSGYALGVGLEIALAYRVGKQALHASMEVPLSAGLVMEGRMYGFLRTTEDFHEGGASL